jgi:hypothetical protein
LTAAIVAAAQAAGVVAVVEVPQASNTTWASGLAACTASVMPCTAVTLCVGSPEYPPSVTVPARSPTIATVCRAAGSAGSNFRALPGTLSSFSSTSELSATFVASSWCGGLSMTSLVIRVYGTWAGGSNSPVRIRMVKTCSRALSTTPSESTPALMASSMFSSVYSLPVQLSWVPARSAYAWAPAAALTR